MKECATLSHPASRATACTPSADSSLACSFNESHYSDCFMRFLPKERFTSPLSTYLEMTKSAPEWVDRLLAFRDMLARWVGMTPTQGFKSREQPPASIVAGDVLDFFQVVSSDGDKVLLSLDDKHFKVMIEVLLISQPQSQAVYVTSTVNPHTAVGTGYLRLIAPFHRAVVRSMLNRVV